MKIKGAYVAGALAFIVTWMFSRGHSSPYNNYVLLADAWLHGRSWIDWPGPYIDALLYNGQHYVIEAPTPAILLLPLVAIWHSGASQTFLSLVLCAVAIGAAWELCERYAVQPELNAWLCAFMLAGTDLLFCAMYGDVWFIAHVSAVCFTLLALVELAGKRRAWLVALYGALAAESRFTLVLALPIYLVILSLGARCAPSVEGQSSDTERATRVEVETRRFNWQPLAAFAAVLVPIAALWVWYNVARWGTWYDIGYTTWYHQDNAGMPTGPPFRLMYVPYELWSFFVQAPAFAPRFPFAAPSISGVALTWTSPALVLAFLARKPRPLVIALWSAALLVAVPSVMYYVNGFAQFGMRHALDFEPFLLLLIALALREPLPRWITSTGYALMAWSMIVGMWGCWYWNSFIRT